jgi:phosphoglycerate-specific signal transduction histidine kinase
MDSGPSISASAHEIKNQLAIILQAVAYLREVSQQPEERIKMTLNYIEEAAGKVDKIVNSMVDSSRPKG